MSDPLATVRRMQSEQRRQRRKELKRLKREEKRRASATPPRPIFERIEWRRVLAPERQARTFPRAGRRGQAEPQMCASRDTQMCAQDDGTIVLPSQAVPVVRNPLKMATATSDPRTTPVARRMPHEPTALASWRDARSTLVPAD